VNWLQTHWYRKSIVSVALLPLSWVYLLLSGFRRGLYRNGVLRRTRLSVPVLVVGNITVGGTGKTPLVVWLAKLLRRQGYRPGIVARGYGGRSTQWPIYVSAESDPDQVGDEAVLLARASACPVMAAPDRVLAARKLLDEHDCNIIVSDDGLQHYALARDVEIAVIDGTRRFGNGYCLPAGPLREPPTRLRGVHARVANGAPRAGELGMRLQALCFRSVSAPGRQRPIGAFAGKRVHALAGIGNPARFFQQLRALDIDPIERALPDHYRYRPQDIEFADDAPVIMTEKDAVKCQPFADQRCWYLEVEAQPDPALAEQILRLVKTVRREG
jgi:tetraacyldisaccharide 4'-kinase